MYDNFRDFIWTLDAKSDQLNELFMYIRDFAEDYFKFSSMNLYISSTPDQLPKMILPSYYSKEIVPIFKEGITNIYKHSEAKNIYLDFLVIKNSLQIKLRDDGKGMNVDTIKKGKGFVNMQYRAKKTKATFDIISSPLNGTELVYNVLLPV